MTPEEARALLDGTTPGPWKWRWDTGALSVFDVEEEPVAIDLDVQDSDLIAAAPTLAAMIAGMREEWGVDAYNPYAPSPQWGFATEEAAREWESTARGPGEAPATILHRYVTEPEEA